ncbi:MAG: hypothetical protein HYW07_10205 [Candidatus Latescibacteria bacterium]|nr:hypothetical protein [Candidatus Latescibacterota bacterium]
MSANLHRLTQKGALPFLVLSMLVLACGCGEVPAPVAPQPATIDPGRVSYLPFLPQAAQRAAKLPSAGLTASQIFSIWGDQFTLTDLNGPGVADDLKVTFSVPSGGLTSPLLISMTLYGNTAQDLVMAFTPSGLLFLGNAELKVTLGDDRLDIPLQQITAYHAYDNGTVVDAKILSRTDGDGTSEIRIEVPGFSRYGMSNGNRN